MRLAKHLLIFMAAFAFLAGCTDAKTSVESLSLKFAPFNVSQNGSSTNVLLVNSISHQVQFDIACTYHHERLQISYDDGATWSTLSALDPTATSCSVAQTLVPTGPAAWPVVAAKLKSEGAEGESQTVDVQFVTPQYANAGQSVVIETGAAVTRFLTVTLGLTAELQAGSIGGLRPSQVYLTSIPGCNSGGSWQSYASVIYGTALGALNAQNFIYAKFRDSAGNESACISDDILHDNTAPTAVSLLIDSGAAQATGFAVALDILGAGDAYEMQINNSADCTGSGAWEPYLTTKAYTLAGPGTNIISLRFRDAAGNDSNCVNDSILFNTAPPATPTSLTLNTGTSATDNKNPVSVVVNPVASGDTAKVYLDSTCTTLGGQATGSNGANATVAVTLGSDGAKTFYARTVNPYTLTSACSSAFVAYTLDSTVATITGVSATNPNSNLATGATVDLTVSFTEPVTVAGSGLGIYLNINGASVLAPYASGSGTTTLHFSYTIQSSHLSYRLDYAAGSAIQLGAATIKDAVGNAASLSLPAPGAANSLGANKNLSINYTLGLARAPGYSAVDNKNPVDIVVSGVLLGYTAKLYSDASCSTLAGQASSAGSGVATVSVSLTGDGARTFYARIFDTGGNGGACSTLSVSYTLDSALPGVLSVSSTTADGNYSNGASIDISVLFSKSITVTGSGLALNLNLNGTTVAAPYASGSGTATLHFTYTVGAGHFSNDLEYAGAAAMQIGSATLTDNLGVNSSTGLPSPGAAGSLSASKNIGVNYNISLALESGTSGTDNKNPVNVVVSGVMTGFTAKLYSDSSCATLVGESASTGLAQATVAATLTGDGAKSIYTKIFDAGGASTACSSSFVAYTLDSIGPSVTGVTSTTANGGYSTGASVDVSVNFSEPVLITGSGVKIGLNLNGTSVDAAYVSGSGSATLRFAYTLQAAHMSNDLDYTDTSGLQAGTATLKDAVGNSAVLTLPSPGAAGSLAANKNISVNYNVTVSFSGSTQSTDNDNPLGLTVTSVMNGFTARVYTDASCSIMVGQATSSGDQAAVSAVLGADGTYNFYVRIFDLSAVGTACSAALFSYSLDTTGPVVTSVTSTSANGNYVTGSSVDVSVNFSEPVTVVGSGAAIELNLNGTTVSAPFASGSGTSILRFTYTVATGNLSNDLDYAAVGSLNPGSATFKDATGNTASTALPAPLAAGSLAASKNITVNYSLSLALAVGTGTTDSKNPVDIEVSGVMTGFTAKAYTDSSCTTLVGSAVSSGAGLATVSVALTGDGARTFYARAFDLLNNPSACSSASVTYTYDTSGPSVVSVSATNANGNYTTAQLVDISITFNKPAYVTGSGLALTLYLNGSTINAPYASGSGTAILRFSYFVQPTHLSEDLDYATVNSLVLGASALKDASGNDAVRTLPAPGTAGSLSANKNLSINYSLDLELAAGVLSVDNDNPVNIKVNGVVNGYTAFVYADSACTTLKGQAIAGSGGYVTVPVSLPSDAALTFYAKVVSPSLVASACSTSSVAYTLDTLGPGITGVTSTNANGDYPTGTVIDISVGLQEAVYVVGSDLTLTLSLYGGNTATAAYTSGSGTATLHFSYTVLNAHSSNDLDYASSAALALNTSTIKDSLGNDADLTLPAPGAAGSLGANKALTINLAVSVSAIISPASRTFFQNETIEFVVRWSGPVIVTGTPNLRLQLTAPGAPVSLTYQAASSSTTESRFTTTVASTWLDADGVTLVDISGATINNTYLTAATRTLPVTSFPNVRARGATAMPVVSFVEAFISVLESAVSSTLTATSSLATPENVNLELRTQYLGGGPTSSDLSLPSLVATITSGSTSATATYDIWDNGVASGAKTVAVQTVGTSLAAMNSGSASKVILIHDNEFSDTVQSIVAGYAHACVLYTSGKVQCFGSNTDGQLGNGNNTATALPSLPYASGVSKIFAGGNSTCAILAADQSLWCWGDNTSYGMLGNGTSVDAYSPVQITALANVQEVSMAYNNTCAIYLNLGVRYLKCWGYNFAGSVGDGTTTSPRLSPVAVALTGVDTVATNSSTTCATVGPSLYCWGSNTNGTVGQGTFTGTYSSPQLVSSSVTFTKLAAAPGTMCGMTAVGAVHCWGSDGSGSLGDGGGYTSTNTVPASAVSLGGTAVSLHTSVSGSGTFCALRSDGAVYCWGYGYNGELFNGLAISSNASPVASKFTGMSKFALGFALACGVDASGNVVCATNENTAASAVRRYLNPDDSSPTPRLMNRAAPLRASMFNVLSCVTETDGSVYCNSVGSTPSYLYAGDGTNVYRASPVKLALTNQVDASGGQSVGCAVGQDKVLRCWGYGSSSNQVGEGIATSRTLPTFIASDIVRVKNGADTSASSVSNRLCALKTTGALLCWGYNGLGQVGNGTTTYPTKPYEVFSSGVTDFATGVDFTCAIVNGVIKCWGSNTSGAVGDASGSPQYSPVDVLDVYGAVPIQIDAGDQFACARYDDNSLRCWGLNNSGQLGRGNTSTAIFPWKISGLSVKDFALGASHSCAITLADDLKCWGSNTYGQLGTGTYTNLSSPSSAILSNVTKVWAGRNGSTCAKTSNANFYCWGANSGLFSYRPSPGLPIPVPGLQY